MKIHLLAPERDSSNAYIIFRAFKGSIVSLPEADAIIVYSSCTDLQIESMLDSGKPVFIYDRIDGAQLGRARKFIEDPRVKGVFKGYTFRDPEKNNFTSGRFHSYRMTGIIESVKDPLSKDALQKIKVGHGFASFSRIAPYLTRQPDYEKKDIPVFFAGTVDYGRDEISRHRKKCVEILKDIPGAVVCEGRGFNPREYMDLMYRSKIVVSPYGYGEACIRDYEAWLSGAILIKPDMRHVRSLPDLHKKVPSFLVDAQWHDLEITVKAVLMMIKTDNYRRDYKEDYSFLHSTIQANQNPKKIRWHYETVMRGLL